MTTFAHAYEDYNTNVSVFVDGLPLEADSEPIIVNDRTLVPVRAISETLNYKVNWDNDNQLVSISDNNKNIFLQIGSHLLHVNDIEYEIDVAPMIYKNRTYVPLRFITETLNCTVDWDNETFSVLIHTNNLTNYLVYEDDYIEFTYPDTWIMSSYGTMTDFNINNEQAIGFVITNDKKEKTLEEYFSDIETTIQNIYFGDGEIDVLDELDREFTNYIGKEKHFAYKSTYSTVYGLKVKLLTFEAKNRFYTFGFFADNYNFNNYAIQIDKIYENLIIKK